MSCPTEEKWKKEREEGLVKPNLLCLERSQPLTTGSIRCSQPGKRGRSGEGADSEIVAVGGGAVAIGPPTAGGALGGGACICRF